jgi:predicted RNA-binding Zn-ribbon protein involved in translation (DUF1610 family)
MKWTLQTEKFQTKDDRGQPKEITISKGYQKDTKGNRLQQGGGIIPKACQNCGDEFNAVIQQDELKQEINMYACENCEFKDARPDQGVLHSTQNPTHKLKVVVEERVVGYKNTLQGSLAVITKTEDDMIILCRNCHDLD